MDASPLRIAVTGHRPAHLFGYDQAHPGWQWLRAELRRVVDELAAGRPCELLSGMALGVDQVFAEVALAARLPLVAFVPFDGQDGRWPPHARAHYERLLRQATRVRFVCSRPSIEAFQVRNEAMVDSCDVLVAVWSGKESGGTFRCVQSALRAGRPVLWLDPLSRRSVLVPAAVAVTPA